jgi:hypothetical protein
MLPPISTTNGSDQYEATINGQVDTGDITAIVGSEE